MSYNYATEKPKLFTEDGQRVFLKIRDHVHALLKTAGAFRLQEAMVGSGDSFTMIAAVERLVELGEIVELPRNCWGQFRVFSTPQVHNR